ncbi:STAS domain-containing protein [Prauserella oleivorans]|uniref:STAS domain-containing protein n=1 Tax=Prauserella oleivorans TaxID=1478153 RepID=A0ABW5WC59_9PSEU
MEVRVDRHPAGLVVTQVLGEVDLAAVSALRVCFGEQLRTARSLVLDFTEASYISAAGLSLLLQTSAEAHLRNVPWALAAARSVLRPIEVTGLDGCLPVYEDVPHAIDAVLGQCTERSSFVHIGQAG